MLAPAIQGQDDESHDGSTATPLVAYLLEVAQAAIGSFDVIVGADALSDRAVQVSDHLGKLVGAQHRQGLGQIRVGQEFLVLDKSRPSAAGLMRTQLGVEQAIDFEHEGRQIAEFGQVLEHSAEPTSFAAAEVLGARDDQMPMFPVEVGLFLLGVATSLAGPFLGLAQASPSRFAFGLVGESTSQAPQGVEDALVDFLHDVKDAKLVAGFGPDFGQHFGVEVRAIGDDDLRSEAMVSPVR